MKSIVFSIFLLLSITSHAQTVERKLYVLNYDNLLDYTRIFDKEWFYREGDNTDYCATAFNDNDWKKIDNRLLYPDAATNFALGIGWFRLHFIADSTVVNLPLSFAITHFGASEIYLDGVLIKKYGAISDRNNTTYEDPLALPFVFTLPSAGDHLLAIRYANFAAQENYHTYKEEFAGFKLSIGLAEKLIASKNQRSSLAAAVLMSISGIFMALCLIHTFMYLYYRKVKSNLYFSILMFSLASIFIISFILYCGSSPQFVLMFKSKLIFFGVLSCLSLSAFTNALFGGKKWLLTLFIGVGILTLIVRKLDWSIYAFLFVGLVTSVALEVLIAVIMAIYRRIKGAKIIGTGILFLVLFILTHIRPRRFKSNHTHLVNSGFLEGILAI